MAVELYANDVSTTVALSKTASAAGTSESWAVASSTGFPAASSSAVPPTQFRIQDPAQTGEIMLVTNVSGTTWTVTRAIEGASTSHAAGFAVRPVFSAGSVATIARSRYEYDVKKDFGATGDGTTDDGPALQSAFNAVPSTGGTITFPPGNYISNRPLILKARTVLQGGHIPYYWAGSTTLDSGCKISVGPSWTGTTGKGLIHCNDTGGGDIKGIKIIGLGLSGNGVAASGGGVVHGIRFPDNSIYNGEMSWRMQDFSVCGFTGSGMYGRLHVCTLINSFVHNNSRYGIEVVGNDHWNDVKFWNCYAFYNALGGLLFAGGPTGQPSALCTFTNCRFERSGQVYGFPTNSPTQGAWQSNAAGVRLQRATMFNFTSCTTDANTGPGFDVLGESGNITASFLNNVTFVGCFANRDGQGTAQTLASATTSAGFRVEGVTATGTDEPTDIHFIGCDSAVGGSNDSGASTITAPAYGGSFVNANAVDWIVGRPAGVTANMNYGSAADNLWASGFIYNDAGRLVYRNRQNVIAEVGSGLNEVTLWRTDAVAAVAAQGLDLASALTELDVTTTGTRTVLNSVDTGVMCMIVINMRAIVQTGSSTIVVSIRDTSNTGNVLATASVTISATGVSIFKSAWTTVPSWYVGAGDKTVAVYTSGGNAANDYIFKSVTVRFKGGGQ